MCVIYDYNDALHDAELCVKTNKDQFPVGSEALIYLGQMFPVSASYYSLLLLITVINYCCMTVMWLCHPRPRELDSVREVVLPPPDRQQHVQGINHRIAGKLC